MLKFFHQAFRNIRTTGSVMPSSQALAQAMTRSACNHAGRKRVLEVGPGTGPFTGPILRSLRPGDAFDVVELNGEFCRHIESRHLAPFRTANPQVTVRLHQGAIEDADLERGYDFIVCGLPFNNFPLALTEAIFSQMIDLLRSGGELTFFEYVGAREVKRPFVGREHRRAIDGLTSLHRATAQRHAVRREIVVANIPPACAVHITKCAAATEARQSCSASTTTT